MFGINWIKTKHIGYLAGALGLAASLWTAKAYAAAGGCSSCLIKTLNSSPDGKVYINTALNMGGPCSLKTNMWFDGTTAAGKTLLSLVQSAFLAGRPVDLAGNNTCTGTVEGLSGITVK